MRAAARHVCCHGAFYFQADVEFSTSRTTKRSHNANAPGRAGRLDERAGAETTVLGDDRMRYMLIIKSDAKTEAGEMPDEAFGDAMGKYNQELIDAGAFITAEGLQASSKG